MSLRLLHGARLRSRLEVRCAIAVEEHRLGGSVYRWVQTFTPEFIDAARPSRHARGDRWFVDETYVKVAGRWTYLYRAVDQHGQVMYDRVSERRNGAAARTFFIRALRHGPSPVEVTTDRAPVYRG
jgi:IS6 family transposase